MKLRRTNRTNRTRRPRRRNSYATRNHHHRVHGSTQGREVSFALHDDPEQEAEAGKAGDPEVQSVFAPSHPASRNQITYAPQNPNGQGETRRARTLRHGIANATAETQDR